MVLDLTSVPTDVIIYCDEAGNTGPDYVNPEQPFYVLAAWSIPYDRIADASAAVELTRQKNTPQAKELKSSSLLSSERGKAAAVRLIDELGELGGVPFFVLAEKRYCIAGKIIETFLDPLTNPRVSNYFIPDTVTKQEIANTLYEQLSDDELNTFASAYRDPKAMTFQPAFDVVVSAVRARINPELADLFEGARSNLVEIEDVEAGTIFGKFFDTLNHPTLASMFTMIEAAARGGFFRPRKFVHDQSHAYEDGCKKLFRIFRNANDGVFEYPSGSISFYPLKHVPKFEMVCSESSQLVQAADILAGSIRHCAMKARAGDSISDNDAELAISTFPLLIKNRPPKLAWPIASDRWYRSMGRTFLAPYFGSQDSDTVASCTSKADASPIPAAAIFPVVSGRSLPDEKQQRFPIPFPAYGLVGKETGCLYCVGDIDFLAERGGTAAFLFPCKEDAEKWHKEAEEGELTEPFELRRFDVLQLQELLQALRITLEITSTLCFCVDCESLRCTDLAEHIMNTERSLDRAKRAVLSGAAKQIYKEDMVDGIKVHSMLASDGSYVAFSKFGDPSISAPTRELAIAAVVEREKAGRLFVS